MQYLINGKRASSNDQLINFLKTEIEEGSSILDLGCGPKLYSNPFKSVCSKIITIDAWPEVEPDILANLESCNIGDLLNHEKFDYILMIDFIEHLSKPAGIKLLDDVKKLTNKKIILLTPLEQIWDDNSRHVNDPSLWCYGNDFDLHKSLWFREDFKEWTPIYLSSLVNYFVGTYSNE